MSGRLITWVLMFSAAGCWVVGCSKGDATSPTEVAPSPIEAVQANPSAGEPAAPDPREPSVEPVAETAAKADAETAADPAPPPEAAAPAPKVEATPTATGDSAGPAANLEASAEAVAQGQSCLSGDTLMACAPGLECIEYYGFAGPRGPKFASCEIRCRGAADCPAGQQCTTIADGPGTVCRSQ